MIDVSGEEDIGKDGGAVGLMAENRRDGKDFKILFYDNGHYWVNYEDGEDVYRVVFKGAVKKQKKGITLMFYDFSLEGRSSAAGEYQMKMLSGDREELTFSKIPRQYFYEYPDSVWESEETGYVISVPSDGVLAEDETAEVSAGLHHSGDVYEMYEPSYNMPAEGCITYGAGNPDGEADVHESYVSFQIMIFEKNGEMYMEWDKFTADDTDGEGENLEIFMKYKKILFKKIR